MNVRSQSIVTGELEASEYHFATALAVLCARWAHILRVDGPLAQPGPITLPLWPPLSHLPPVNSTYFLKILLEMCLF